MVETGESTKDADNTSTPRRRSEWFALVVVVIAAVAGVIYVFSAKDQGSRPPVTTMATVHVSGMSARLELDEAKVKAGADVHGTLIVTNTTGKPVPMTKCGAPFKVALYAQRFTPMMGYPACDESFTIPTGTSTYRVAVITTYGACTNTSSDASPEVPPCSADGQPPDLPKGTYEVGLGRGVEAVGSIPKVTIEIH